MNDMITKIFIKLFKSIKNKVDGQSTIEFILLIPFIFLVICMIFQLGYTFYIQNNLEQICRELARIIATTNSNEMALGFLNQNSFLKNLNSYDINIFPSLEGERKIGSFVQVSINASYEGVFGIIKEVFKKNIIISSESSMRMECENGV